MTNRKCRPFSHSGIRCGSWNHGAIVQLDRATGLYHAARWTDGVLVGIRLRRKAWGLRACGHQRCFLQLDASSGSDADCHRGANSLGTAEERSPSGGGQYLDPEVGMNDAAAKRDGRDMAFPRRAQAENKPQRARRQTRLIGMRHDGRIEQGSGFQRTFS